MKDVTITDMVTAVERAHRLAMDVAFKLHDSGDDDAVDDILEHITALNAAATELRRMALEKGEARQ